MPVLNDVVSQQLHVVSLNKLDGAVEFGLVDAVLPVLRVANEIDVAVAESQVGLEDASFAGVVVG